MRGSTAHQPTGSPSRYATRPVVASAAGSPHCVWASRRAARSSAGNLENASFGRSLYRWHWQRGASPRFPNTVCRSSQAASFAGTTVSSSASSWARPNRTVNHSTRSRRAGPRRRPARRAAHGFRCQLTLPPTPSMGNTIGSPPSMGICTIERALDGAGDEASIRRHVHRGARALKASETRAVGCHEAEVFAGVHDQVSVVGGPYRVDRVVGGVT